MVRELSPGNNYWFRNCWKWIGVANGDNENMIWKESEACMEGHLVCGGLFCLADPRTVVLDYEPRPSVQTMRWREWVILTKLLACAHLSMGPLVWYFHLGVSLMICWNGSRKGIVLEIEYVPLFGDPARLVSPVAVTWWIMDRFAHE